MVPPSLSMLGLRGSAPLAPYRYAGAVAIANSWPECWRPSLELPGARHKRHHLLTRLPSLARTLTPGVPSIRWQRLKCERQGTNGGFEQQRGGGQHSKWEADGDADGVADEQAPR